MNEYLPAGAILRLDPGWREVADEELPNLITVVAVVPTVAEADAEVSRLHEINGDHSTYFRAYTRWYPAGRRAQSSSPAAVEWASVLLSMQRALWEQITPNLRGVTVSLRQVAGDQVIASRFLYEGTIGEVERECVSLAETYCIADFGPEVVVTFEPVENAAKELVDTEAWMYLRHEPDGV